MIYLTAERILFLHSRLISETRGSHGVHDIGLLLAAVARPQATFEKQDLYPNLFSKAAALMESFVKNHPFVDGNKRTGIGAAAMFLALNGFHIAATNEQIVTFTIEVAKGNLSLAEIIKWLEAHSTPGPAEA